MNKVHGKTTFIQNKLFIHKLRQETCFFAKNGQLLSCRTQRKNNLDLPNPCGQLLQNFLHMFL
jgi:hypothetical protein